VIIATLFHGAVNTLGFVNAGATPAVKGWGNAVSYGLVAVLIGALARNRRLARSRRESIVQPSERLSRWTLRLDAVFVAVAGVAAMIVETVGHFLGVGPMAGRAGSPYTIGSFEAHGLAIIIAFLLLRASALPDRWLWHVVGLSTHLLLGSSNLLFWPSFVQTGQVMTGVVTTALHIIFTVAHAACTRPATRLGP
jgi:hypothetical protein